jgi:hypothetical protein
MQPPPPRKPVPSPSLGERTNAPASATRHPQGPSDFASDDGTAQPRLSGTRDHALIRAWADHHGAEPATGEATASGPAVLDVNDQGAGVRFNFPAASRFRPVEWDEWLTCFDRDRLVFVFETREGDGESTLDRFGGAYYRLVTVDAWGSRPLSTHAAP